MQRYFQAAKHVTQLNTILLQNLEAALFPAARLRRPSRSTPSSAICGGLLDAIDPDAFERDPAASCARSCAATAPAVSGMTVPTLRAIWHARTRIDARFRADPANRALFLEHPAGSRAAITRTSCAR